MPRICLLTVDQAHNIGMYPAWESNPQLFGVWDDTPTNQVTLARAKLNFNNFFFAIIKIKPSFSRRERDRSPNFNIVHYTAAMWCGWWQLWQYHKVKMTKKVPNLWTGQYVIILTRLACFLNIPFSKTLSRCVRNYGPFFQIY